MKVILAAVLKGTWKRMLSMGSFWKTIGNGFRASWTQIRRDLIVNTRNQQPMKTKSETAETFHDDQTPMRKRKNSEMTELEGNADVFQRKWMIFITGVKSISWQKKKKWLWLMEKSPHPEKFRTQRSFKVEKKQILNDYHQRKKKYDRNWKWMKKFGNLFEPTH